MWMYDTLQNSSTPPQLSKIFSGTNMVSHLILQPLLDFFTKKTTTNDDNDGRPLTLK